MILDTSDSNMPKKRPTFLYRRKHAEDFPYCCDTCVPELRFKLLRHKEQHDNVVHGIPIISHESKKAAMISSLHAAPMSTLACTSPLSAVTMRQLNTFIETEIENIQNTTKAATLQLIVFVISCRTIFHTN